MPGMNAHLDIDSEYGRKLAGTLRSLSIGPVPHDIETPKKTLRRLHLPIGLSLLIGGIMSGVVLYQAVVIRSIGSTITALPDKPKTAVDSASLPGETQSSQPFRNIVGAIREITGSGFVVAPRMTTVFAKYEGRITRIAVEVGDNVEEGQALVVLDDAGTRFALEQARAARTMADLVLAARALDLAQARASLDRTETLAAKDAASRQNLEETRTAMGQASNALAQARQSVASADLSIRVAEERLAELVVRSPFSGTVTTLDAHVGDTVLARTDSVRESQSLLSISDTQSLFIDADVAETNIAALKPGLAGTAVLDGFPDRPFPVEVQRLAPVASAAKGTVALRLSLDDPPAGIRPNMAARIRISLNEAGEPTQ